MLTLCIGLIFQPLPLVLHQPCQQSPLVTNLNQQGSFQICRLQAPNGFQQTCYSSYFILDLVTAPELVQPHHSLRICPAWRRVFLEVIPFISIFNHESGSDRIGHILRNFKRLIDLCDCILTHAWVGNVDDNRVVCSHKLLISGTRIKTRSDSKKCVCVCSLSNYLILSYKPRLIRRDAIFIDYD